MLLFVSTKILYGCVPTTVLRIYVKAYGFHVDDGQSVGWLYETSMNTVFNNVEGLFR